MCAPEHDSALGRALIECARDEIAVALRVRGRVDVPEHPGLAADGATFVTLMRHDALRGCIGTLAPHRTLEADVRSNARAAALRDPRFEPMIAREFGSTRIEVSLLGAPAPVAARDESDALGRLRPREDGVILVWRDRKATFLPQVWSALPEPRDFLRELKRKAGLAPDFWSDEIALSRYRVAKWSERAPGVFASGDRP